MYGAKANGRHASGHRSHVAVQISHGRPATAAAKGLAAHGRHVVVLANPPALVGHIKFSRLPAGWLPKARSRAKEPLVLKQRLGTDHAGTRVD